MYNNWKYKKRILLNGSSGAGTNYQVLLKIGENPSVSGCNFSISSEKFPSKENDGGDLFFTSNGGNPLGFWVESVTGTAPNRLANVWVKVSDNLDNNVYIYCYYGNSGAPNYSNGDNTFIFFDDFSGDLSKWTGYDSHFSISNGRLKSTGNTGTIFIWKNLNIDNCSVEVIINQTTDSNDCRRIYYAKDAVSGNPTVGTYNSYWLRWDTNQLKMLKNGEVAGATVSQALNANTDYRLRFDKRGSNFEMWFNGVSKQLNQNWTTFNVTSVHLSVESSTTCYFDNFFIRKNVSSEPSFNSAQEYRNAGRLISFFFPQSAPNFFPFFK